MPRAVPGVPKLRTPTCRIELAELNGPLGILVQCDASIKAIISKIDEENHDIIVADLDDETLIVKDNKLAVLKERLAEVSPISMSHAYYS